MINYWHALGDCAAALYCIWLVIAVGRAGRAEFLTYSE
jgi:hypothetical protein